jgi:hypothetical protein
VRIEPSKSGIEIIQCSQAFMQLLWLEEGRVGLQTVEEGAQTAVAYDFTLVGVSACSG